MRLSRKASDYEKTPLFYGVFQRYALIFLIQTTHIYSSDRDLIASRIALVKSLFSAHETHGILFADNTAFSLLTLIVSYGKESSSFVPVFGVGDMS